MGSRLGKIYSGLLTALEGLRYSEFWCKFKTSITVYFLVCYQCPDALVHIVTMNGRFYTDGTHPALTHAKYLT